MIAINKMDLVSYDKKIFESITHSFEKMSKNFDFLSKNFIPMSALNGDNVFIKSKKMSWYQSEALIGILESFDISKT